MFHYIGWKRFGSNVWYVYISGTHHFVHVLLKVLLPLNHLKCNVIFVFQNQGGWSQTNSARPGLLAVNAVKFRVNAEFKADLVDYRHNILNRNDFDQDQLKGRGQS